MPEPKKNETKQKYISRCIAYCVKNEGLSQKAATGKCYGMWEQKHGKKKDLPEWDSNL